MNRTTLVLVLVILGIGSYVAWFLSTHDRVEEYVNHGYTGEARLNQFLAAEMYLQKIGQQADGLPYLISVGHLVPQDSIVVLGAEISPPTEEESRRLLHWTRQGGMLVFDLNDSFKHLLALLEAKAKHTQTKTPTMKIKYFTDSAELTIADNKQRIVYSGSTPHQSVNDGLAAVLLHLRYGEGEIILLNHPSIFHNDKIGSHDHAALLERIVKTRPQAKTWFIYAKSVPSFFGLFWHYFQWFLMTLAVTFLLWWWSSSRRYGPLLPATVPVRRSLMEHIRASGRLLWKEHAQRHLVHSARKRLLKILENRYPQWHSNPTRLAEELARATSLPERSIVWSLQVDQALKEDEFSEAIIIIEKIRSKL